MTRFLSIICLVGVLVVSATACSHKTVNNTRVSPADEFTLTQDDIANEILQANRAIKGEWKYKGPSVDVSGKNVLAGLGKPIAKSKLKKKLKDAFKKIGLEKARPQFTFNEDGTCAISMLGVDLNGKYNYNPSKETITFKWHGISLSAHLKQAGKKKAYLTFDTDKLLSLFQMVSRFSDSSTMKSLAFLTEYYDDVMVGFELKK